jgi:hypothetical protein
MNWDEFATRCPEIAAIARPRFEKDELVLVGTIRGDGSPRISPNEVDFGAGRLFLGMMWQSKKALDLARDPRLVAHSVPAGRMNPGGDVKLYGRALEEPDPSVRRAFEDAIQARIAWRPPEPYHLFSVDVESAAYIVFGEGGHAMAWDPERGLRRREVH